MLVREVMAAAGGRPWDPRDVAGDPDVELACVHTLVSRQAAAQPTAPALVFGAGAGAEVMTYGELDAASSATARWMRREFGTGGTGEGGAAVGIALARSPVG